MSTMERPDHNLEKYHSAEYVCDWQQLRDFYESHFRTGPQWIFRGQQQSAWGLQSRFEREMAHFGIAFEQAARIEDGFLRRFKRQCYHYLSNTPEEQDALEWLALMQHYGTPTRLLDWTYSFFVALYFAIESAAQGGAAVWALNTDWMVRPFASVLESHAEGFLRWQRDTGIVQRETFTL